MKQRLIAASVAVLPGVVLASSEEAWDDFRASVENTCVAAISAPETASVTIEVNPFGSESYGAALVTVGNQTGQDRMVCIFDKRTQAVEITAPFADAAPAE
ncbi:hypothetical protein RAH32_01450 [Paracoccus sp. WLY502]|uniref:hypothetical protein n=1 Tax=Paracoccus yibinensis TaxID=3068891 RepID=UPI00279658F6|nr:hypothetical protein [Paracoccus sp. WLY502]MDQ1899115.1 hypothetical protein [Paracoccus sp. WLY502]